MQILKTENYAVSFNPGDPRNLIISVSSLGYVKLERYEQFWGGIRKTGSSALFLADLKGHWFNHIDTEEVFRYISTFALRFDNVAIIGDSMGGSGAILLSNYVFNATRVLAFAPQFSVARPFIEFDIRYRDYVINFKKLYFDNFGFSKNKANSVIFYGNTVWMDQIHQAMFSSLEFPIITIDRAPHEVAKFLHSKDRLQAILNALGNFAVPFSVASMRQLAAGLIGDAIFPHLSVAGGSDDHHFRERRVLNEPDPPNSPLVSAKCTANQSSLSRWSYGSSTKEDASRATDPLLRDEYAFHTSFEMEPWWEVELREQTLIEEIRIYNRLGGEKIVRRANSFVIEASCKDGVYHNIFTKLSRFPIMGEDGSSFNWRPSSSIKTNKVRIKLNGWGALHLRRVEIFGET